MCGSQWKSQRDVFSDSGPALVFLLALLIDDHFLEDVSFYFPDESWSGFWLSPLATLYCGPSTERYCADFSNSWCRPLEWFYVVHCRQGRSQPCSEIYGIGTSGSDHHTIFNLMENLESHPRCCIVIHGREMSNDGNCQGKNPCPRNTHTHHHPNLQRQEKRLCLINSNWCN